MKSSLTLKHLNASSPDQFYRNGISENGQGLSQGTPNWLLTIPKEKPSRIRSQKRCKELLLEGRTHSHELVMKRMAREGEGSGVV